MTGMETAATAEERTELSVLHEQAAADAREVAETVVALADRLAESVNPRRWPREAAARSARSTAARARDIPSVAVTRARRAARQTMAHPVPVGWPKLAAATGVTAGLLIAVAVAVTWQHRRHG
jgi:hypothetical protein